MVDDQLTFTSHVEAAVNKANKILGLIRISYSHLDKISLRHLYTALVRPHLEYGNVAWSPRHLKDLRLLENVQHRATKLVPELRNLPYEERLRRLGLPSLFYRRTRGDTIEVYKFLHKVYEMPHTLLERAAESPTRGHSFKLNKKHCRIEVRKNFFSMRAVNNWNSLPDDTVKAPCLNTFKARLDCHWSKIIYGRFQNFRHKLAYYCLLSLHSVCHVTIAHCNDSNGTDTRVRVRCNDSDVTDRKQSRVCNDSTVTDMSWAIATCDGHINCWQSKVWKPQNMELPYTEWNLIAYAQTLQCAGQRNRCISVAVIVTCRQNKRCYRKNCDGQRNTCVAIAKIVTDQSCYFVSVTDWLLLSLLLGWKIMYKCCYRYTVMDTSRRLRDGQLTETSYCSTHFFSKIVIDILWFFVRNSFEKRLRNYAVAASLNASLWYRCNDSTDVRHKFNFANLSWMKLWFDAKVFFIKVHTKTALTFCVGNTKLNIILISVTSQIRHKYGCYRYIVAIVT